MLCPKCGKQIPDNAAVCKKCGEVFKVNNNNSQTLDYINKEKEKAQKRAEKLNAKQKAKSAKQKSKKPVNKRSVVLIIVAAVLVLAAAAVLLIHFDIISLPGQNKDEALKIEYTAEEVSDENAVMKLGDVNISDTEYSFFFHQSYSNIQNNAQLMFKEFMSKKLGEDFDENTDYYDEYYSDFLKENPSAFDYRKPIESQTTQAVDSETGDTMSWLEYIRQDAVDTMAKYRIRYALAQDFGIELTDDIRYQVYDHIEGLRSAVLGGGYKTLDQYLQILFGEECDEEFFKNELIREYTASKYDTVINSEYMYEYSDEEIKKIYESDYKNYDFADLSVWEATGPDANQTAEKIAQQAKDEASFTQAVATLSGSSSERTSYPIVPKYYIDQNFSAEVGEWAFDRERKANETAVFKTENGYTVVLVQTPSYTQKDCFSYREIVLKKTDENGKAYTGEELENVKEHAESIYKKVRKGDENTFAYYAISASQGDNASSGGLYTCALKSDVSQDISDWALDKTRQTGDVSFIESNESYTIVYFIKNIGDYWNYAVRSTKATEKSETEFEKAKTETFAPETDEKYRNECETAAMKEINEIYLGIK